MQCVTSQLVASETLKVIQKQVGLVNRAAADEDKEDFNNEANEVDRWQFYFFENIFLTTDSRSTV